MSDSTQLPLFGDIEEPDPHAAGKHARRAPKRARDSEPDAVQMAFDLTPPAPAVIEAEPPEPASVEPEQGEPEPVTPYVEPTYYRTAQYPEPNHLLPTILDAPSAEALEGLAKQIIGAGDAPGIAAELVEVVRGVIITNCTDEQRANAAVMLRCLRQPVVVEPLVAAIWDDSALVRLALVETLTEIGLWPETSYDTLVLIIQGMVEAVNSPHTAVRMAAARSLARLRAVVAVPHLLERFDAEESEEVRDEFARTLGILGTPDVVEPILTAYYQERSLRNE